MNRQEQLLWLWLAGVLGYGAEHSGELLDLYGDAAEIYRTRHTEDFRGILSSKQVQRLTDDEKLPEDYQSVLSACERKGVRLLCLPDPDYPRRIAQLPDAPPVLYCTGNAAALNGGPFLGMVGSRTPSSYGVQAAWELGGPLAEAGAVIVSGLADGLDGEAHKAALDAGAPTIGVLGCAIDKTYPASHGGLRREMEKQGAVISEYGPGQRSYPNYFLQRNRLIAGLSNVLCVLEARKKSGTMSTVHHAQRYGRPVYAVPGSVFSPISEGTNQLLAQGIAKPLMPDRTLEKALGLDTGKAKTVPKTSAAPPQDPDQQAVLQALQKGSMSLEDLLDATDLGVGQALTALTMLELAGRIKVLAGSRYVLNK